MKKLFLLCLYLSLHFVFAEAPLKTLALSYGDLTWVVEAARTWPEKIKGLQKRESLAADSGMLFFYEEPQILSFWMKDTWIPLSIAFLDENGCILQIEKMKPLSLKPVRSRKKCLYALEMNRGWFEKHGLHPGDVILIPGVLPQEKK